MTTTAEDFFERWWAREERAGIGIRDGERELGVVKAVAKAAYLSGWKTGRVDPTERTIGPLRKKVSSSQVAARMGKPGQSNSEQSLTQKLGFSKVSRAPVSLAPISNGRTDDA